MPAYVRLIEDSDGDLLDVEFFCDWHSEDILPWPCYAWPDYDVHCTTCGELIHKGDN